MRKVALAIGIALVAVTGYVAAGPYLTISEIKEGVVEQDSEKLSKNIEFPLLRQNLKDQINAVVMESAVTEMEDNPFAALAVGLATKMSDAFVDAFVTPAGLAAAMKGERPQQAGGATAGGEAAPSEEDLFRNARYSFDSPSQFSVWVPDEQGSEARFILERRGLSWKLVNLVIPFDEPGTAPAGGTLR